MKKHFWIGPPEHQNPSDHVELWLEDGDIDLTKPKRSKKGETKKEDQYLLVGFDTEFKTPDKPVTNDEIYAGMARSLILSYQYYAKTPDGFVWQGLCCPDGDERITLSEFMMFVISCGSRIHGLKSIPSKIYLVGHFTRADVPAFKDFSDINRQFSAVRNTFVSIDNYTKVVVNTMDDDEIDLKVYIRDTMLLTPQSSRSLKKIGELVGFEKVELSPDKSTKKQMITNMDRVRTDQWELFKSYALTDAEICVRYIEEVMKEYKSVTGKSKVPITLTGIGMDLLELKWTDSGYNRLDVLGKELVEDKSYIKSKGYYVKKNVEIDRPLVRYNELFAIDCYHGGRNEQYWFGPCFEDSWSDFDLSSAYPTAMSLIGMPNWEEIYKTEDIELFTPETLGFATVDFEFPSHIRFPTLPVRTANGLVFPLKGRSDCCSPEIYLAHKLGAKLTIKYGVIVKTDLEKCVFEEFIIQCNSKRVEAGKKTLRGLFWKEISNSTYGKTAQGLKDRRVYDLRDRETKSLPHSRVTNAYYAAYITSFVRGVLGEIMNSIPKDKIVFSCTTDGFLSNMTDKEATKTTTGELCVLYKRQRKLLANDDEILEKKHQIRNPLGWRTRGQATLIPGEDKGKGDSSHILLAKGGLWIRPEFEETQDQNDEILRHFFERTPDTAIDIEGKTGLRDMVERGADFVEKIVTKRLNMEFDWKRRPLGVTYSNTYDHVAFSTEPWNTVEQFNLMREKFDDYQRNSPRCIKTVEDFQNLSTYIETITAASSSDLSYIRKQDGDIKRLRQMLCAAFKQRKAGFKFVSMTNQDFATCLTQSGIKCTKADVENGLKKDFIPHQVPPTDRVKRVVADFVNNVFPKLQVDQLFVKVDKEGLVIRLSNDQECEFISKVV